jgi:hypothetical protein
MRKVPDKRRTNKEYKDLTSRPKTKRLNSNISTQIETLLKREMVLHYRMEN